MHLGYQILIFQEGYHLQSIILKVCTSSSQKSMVKVSNNSSKRKKKNNSKRKDWKYMEIGLYVIFVARFITKSPHRLKRNHGNQTSTQANIPGIIATMITMSYLLDMDWKAFRNRGAFFTVNFSIFRAKKCNISQLEGREIHRSYWVDK